MGAEREDTDLNPKRVGTEPGLGKASGASPAAAATVQEDPAAPVDFDALHAALGDPLEYDELSSGAAVEKGSDDLLDSLEADGAALDNSLRVGESSGQSSATYSSARPRTIPPTRAPVEDPNAPAVIVASDTDTVPTAPPKMTMPLKPGAPPPFAGGPPSSNPQLQAAHPSGPHGASAPHPSSGPYPTSPPFTPQPFPVQGRQGHMTMRMPDRPVGMRRGKTPTIVMRRRGPSAMQKLVAFMAMLLLVTACGIAVIIWRKPALLGLDRSTPGPAPSASAAPATGAASGSASSGAPTSASAAASAASALSGSASGSASASASAKKVPKPAPVPPHPAGSALK